MRCRAYEEKETLVLAQCTLWGAGRYFCLPTSDPLSPSSSWPDKCSGKVLLSSSKLILVFLATPGWTYHSFYFSLFQWEMKGALLGVGRDGEFWERSLSWWKEIQRISSCFFWTLDVVMMQGTPALQWGDVARRMIEMAKSWVLDIGKLIIKQPRATSTFWLLII